MLPLDVMAEPRRREILALLAEFGESSVTELAARMDVSRPAVSQHLKILTTAGLVSARASGRHRLFCLEPDGLQRARAAIEIFLVNELDDLESAARTRQSTRTPKPEHKRTNQP